ncbi:MAG: nucleoside-diphosphate sugar epimerase, partial [Pseudomonadota bacterium]|nr:nucleoside-diphosphate sugar epimerase [Pseudomonadota bacterium]
MEHSPQSPSTWTITDGNAGNLRQARALADALHRPAVAWNLLARAPWRWAAPHRLPWAANAWG